MEMLSSTQDIKSLVIYFQRRINRETRKFGRGFGGERDNLQDD